MAIHFAFPSPTKSTKFVSWNSPQVKLREQTTSPMTSLTSWTEPLTICYTNSSINITLKNNFLGFWKPHLFSSQVTRQTLLNYYRPFALSTNSSPTPSPISSPPSGKATYHYTLAKEDFILLESPMGNWKLSRWPLKTLISQTMPST